MYEGSAGCHQLLPEKAWPRLMPIRSGVVPLVRPVATTGYVCCANAPPAADTSSAIVTTAAKAGCCSLILTGAWGGMLAVRRN